MAISFVQGKDGSGTSITLTSAPTNGNLLIASAWNLSGVPTTGSGWTQIDTLNLTVDGATYWKIAGVGESATQTPIGTTTSNICIAEFSSTAGFPANPIDVHSIKQGTAASPPTVTTTSVTPTVSANAAFVSCWDNLSTDTAPASITGMTNIATLSGGPTGNGLAAYQISVGTSAITKTCSWTGTHSATSAATIIVFKENSGTVNTVTATDTLGSISETATRNAQAFFRTATDTLGSISETVTRAAQAFIRTSSDTLSALSDSVSRLNSFPRAVSDTLGAISDSASRAAQSFIRSGSDTLGAISDSPLRLVAQSRSISDTLGALSDSLSRILTLRRTFSDSLGAISDTATRASQAFTRTASDTLSALADSAAALKIIIRSATDTLSGVSDTASRSAQAFTRLGSDTLGAISDSLSRGVALLRPVSDTLAALSDTASRSIQHFIRTASDTLSALSDVASSGSVHHFFVTASDTLGSISETASRGAMSFLRSGTDTLAALSDTATRATQSFLRSTADTVAVITDSPLRIQALNRAIADSVAGVSETLNRGLHLGRALSDTLAGLSETLTRAPQQFIRTASESVSGLTDLAVGFFSPVRARVTQLLTPALFSAQAAYKTRLANIERFMTVLAAKVGILPMPTVAAKLTLPKVALSTTITFDIQILQ